MEKISAGFRQGKKQLAAEYKLYLYKFEPANGFMKKKS